MRTTYPDRPGETDAAPAAVEGHGWAPHTTRHAPQATSVEATGGQLGLPQMSHAIRLTEDSIKSENVAIPTLIFQHMKG